MERILQQKIKYRMNINQPLDRKKIQKLIVILMMIISRFIADQERIKL
jgi:hypothetical protein